MSTSDDRRDLEEHIGPVFNMDGIQVDADDEKAEGSCYGHQIDSNY
jgi:hypothetical protein